MRPDRADDASGSRSLKGRPSIAAAVRRRDADGLAQIVGAKRCRAELGRGRPAIGLGSRAGQRAQAACPFCARPPTTAIKQGQPRGACGPAHLGVSASSLPAQGLQAADRQGRRPSPNEGSALRGQQSDIQAHGYIRG